MWQSLCKRKAIHAIYVNFYLFGVHRLKLHHSPRLQKDVVFAHLTVQVARLDGRVIGRRSNGRRRDND